MKEFQGGSNSVKALNSSNPFETNDALFAGSSWEQAATHQGKLKHTLLSLPEAIDLPLLVARDLTQHSPLIAETLSLRDLAQPSTDEQKDVLTGKSHGSPLVHPDGSIEISGHDRESDKKDNKAIKATLAEAITSVKAQLKPFADDPLLTAKLHEAFGDRWNIEDAQALLEQLSSNDRSKFPNIRLKILPVNQLEAQSAFAASTNTIYLFEDFLSRNVRNPETIATILLEEVGHYIDAQLNELDSPGDEGAMFAAIVQNHQLSNNDWKALKRENDFALLFDQGRPTIVEQAVLGGTAGNDYIVGTTVNDEIYGGAGNDTLSGGASNDYLYGDVGDDVLDGGSGNDDMSGGVGND